MKTTNNLNPHILLVIKWLRNPNSVTQEELDANADASYASRTAYAYAAYAAAAAASVAYAYAAYATVATNATAATNAAERRVNKYFEITKENKQDYIDALTEKEGK